jgi:hypothetical protein
MTDKRGNFIDDFHKAFEKGIDKASEEYEKEKNQPPKYDITPMKEGKGGFVQPDDDGMKP